MPLSPQNQLSLLQVESLSHLAKNDFPTAEKILLTAHQQNPKDEDRLGLLTQMYIQTSHYTNALETIQQQLKLTPEKPGVLFTEAVVEMQLSHYPKAIEILDRVLKLQPKNFDALLNRAISHLQNKNFDLAKRDYETLLSSLPRENTYTIYFRLADVAEKQNNKSEAIKNYKAYLKRAPKDAPDRPEAEMRIKKLQGEKS